MPRFGYRLERTFTAQETRPRKIAKVLHIVYLTEQSRVSKGGFYPNGMNGALKTT
jgi:hypothetical protein